MPRSTAKKKPAPPASKTADGGVTTEKAKEADRKARSAALRREMEKDSYKAATHDAQLEMLIQAAKELREKRNAAGLDYGSKMLQITGEAVTDLDEEDKQFASRLFNRTTKAKHTSPRFAATPDAADAPAKNGTVGEAAVAASAEATSSPAEPATPATSAILATDQQQVLEFLVREIERQGRGVRAMEQEIQRLREDQEAKVTFMVNEEIKAAMKKVAHGVKEAMQHLDDFLEDRSRSRRAAETASAHLPAGAVSTNNKDDGSHHQRVTPSATVQSNFPYSTC